LILLVVGWRVAFSVVGWRVAFSRHGQKRGNAADMDHARSAASASVQPPSFSPHELPFLQIVECSLLIQIKNRGATNRPDATLGGTFGEAAHYRNGSRLAESPADIEDSDAPRAEAPVVAASSVR